jgi:hypothetical protein
MTTSADGARPIVTSVPCSNLDTVAIGIDALGRHLARRLRRPAMRTWSAANRARQARTARASSARKRKYRA